MILQKLSSAEWILGWIMKSSSGICEKTANYSSSSWRAGLMVFLFVSGDLQIGHTCAPGGEIEAYSALYVNTKSRVCVRRYARCTCCTHKQAKELFLGDKKKNLNKPFPHTKARCSDIEGCAAFCWICFFRGIRCTTLWYFVSCADQLAVCFSFIVKWTCLKKHLLIMWCQSSSKQYENTLN